MLDMDEMRTLARKLSLEQFRRQVGPFVLIQRPPGQSIQTDPMGIPIGAQATRFVRLEDASVQALSLIFEFEGLRVASLPPLEGSETLTVGRQPDCEVVVDDPSVSKRHALLRWDADGGFCTVQDVGSTNGTMLNASVMVRGEVPLRDGDIVGFGDVQFWYLLADTLHAKLSGHSGASRLGSFSG